MFNLLNILVAGSILSAPLAHAQDAKPFVSPLRTSHQVSLAHIDQMADVPQPLKIIDYKKLALDFDRIVYDFNQTDAVQKNVWPLIWWDRTGDNYKEPMVGLYTALGDARQGANTNGGRFHEALTSMGAV
ncbi:MAG: hypothetical protein EOP05_14910, partial [Proteobacteria bacterium]